MSREKQLDGLLLTVTGVTLAPDFKRATIYFSTLNPGLNFEETEALLDELGHHWHHQIGQRVRLKYLPRFHFKYDAALARGDRVLNLLRKIEEESPPGASAS